MSFAEQPTPFNPPTISPAPDPGPEPEEKDEVKIEEIDLLNLLQGYFHEAKDSREGGEQPRKTTWDENIAAYWEKRDWSAKQPWQSRETLPHVHNYVERFAASLRQALTQSRSWGEVLDPNDKDGMISRQMTKFTRLLLDKSGQNGAGQPIAFEKTFGDIVRDGALMAMCAAVTWKGGRCRVEPVDPRSYYPDHTGRNVYRCRVIEIDRHTLLRMADEKDGDGKPIWDKAAIEAETSNRDWDVEQDKRDSSQAGQEITSKRKPMILHEWLCDLVDNDGNPIGNGKQLVVTLNDRKVIRGPEPNPFWHGQDWIVYSPILSAPVGAVDGRSYVELFRGLVATLENVTNMVIDAVRMNSMNANVIRPELLEDPQQIKQGVYPNMALVLSEDADDGSGRKVLESVELGRHLGPEAMSIYQAVGGMVREAGAQSELSLGQTVAKGDTTATEAQLSNQGQSSLNNSIARDIEEGFLAPILMLVFYTGIQHVDEGAHPEIVGGLGSEVLQMIMSQREEFKTRPMSFRARGISSMMERNQRMRGEIGALNVIGGNPALVAEFQKQYSLSKYIAMILEDFSVDVDRIKLDPEERAQMLQQSELARIQAGATGAAGVLGQQGGAAVPTAQNQGGTDPLAQGAGLDGSV